jgi:hypothetical protein
MSYHVAYCGQSGIGKTTAALWTSRQAWRLGRRRSIVSDPNPQEWGPQALVFRGKKRIEAFWQKVWASRDCNVYVDDVTSSMPRSSELDEEFTRIRHLGHQMHFMLHVNANLTPLQRDQLGTVFLFNQIQASCDKWAEDWNEPRMKGASLLPKFHFLLCRKFCDRVTGLHSVVPGTFPPI